MDLQTYGRHLAETLAERSLHAIRGTSMHDLRRLITEALPASMRPQPVVSAGVTIGAFAAGAALGAGLTALYTPTTGAELRKKLTTSARDATQQAVQLGESVRSRIDDARTTIATRAERSASAGAPRKAEKRKSNGHAKKGAAHAHARAHT